MQRCSFHDYDINSGIKQKRKMALWIKEVIKKHFEDYNINYILCSDEYLLRLNKEFLQHKTLTDIITFDLSKDSSCLIADIYISVERVEENAKKYKVAFTQEFLRVVVHGVLHLLGFKDKSEREKQTMRRLESKWMKYYTDNILPL